MTTNLIEGALLGVDIPASGEKFTLTQVSGVEQISSLFSFNLVLQPSDGSTDIVEGDLLGKPITFQINHKTGNPRYFNGIISDIHTDTTVLNGMQQYVLTMAPYLWFLSKSQNCRIFQQQSVTEILEKIFKECGLQYYNLSGVTGSGKQNKREYCVQYRETTLDFISRLMEEEGIFYYFTHEKGKHTLVVSDSSATCKQCKEPKVECSTGSGGGNAISGWEHYRSFRSNKVTQNDYNYATSDSKLQTEASVKSLPNEPTCEIYDYPGKYANKSDGKVVNKYHMDAIEAGADVVSGSSAYCDFAAGTTIDLIGHENEEELDDYLLLNVHHEASDSSASGQQDGGSQSYWNTFMCIPRDTSYCPHHTIAKPVISGIQTAFVVGNKGDEVCINENGYVKVQFHWDRESKCSCWVRAAQMWAGQHRGSVFHPRVGDEVVVAFLEGDPDRPLIIGSVYNSANKVIYSSPTQSGIKTSSSKGGAGSNELRFEDKAGSEEIFVHAQKDFSRVTENNDSLTVNKGNQSIDVKNGTYTLEAAQSIMLKVGGNTVVIDTSGITINGSVVNVNK